MERMSYHWAFISKGLRTAAVGRYGNYGVVISSLVLNAVNGIIAYQSYGRNRADFLVGLLLFKAMV
ncbi:hypothetical protein CTE07_25320 [Chitinophaga terrae (ex Kim and Jung 2007)]|nr:hypothetical protein CTE07_25320 [Chitinophaga terrae (ex Kim and Jung 2007)]